MSKTISKLKDFYNSPIISNVIASLIFPVIIYLGSNLYSFIQLLYAEFSIESFADFTKKSISIDISLLSLALIILISVLSSMLLLIYSLKTFYKTIRHILNKKYKKQSPYPNLISSTANFCLRVAQSFPGTRDILWVENSIAIRKHLKKFFEAPLTYTSKNGSSKPIWWFRGGANMPIDSFRILSFDKYLIGYREYKIKRIAVYHDGVRDDSDFIYVEVSGEKPTGLYKKSKKSFEEELKRYGCVVEEYAIYKYLKIFKKKLTRAEYDDGATQICGRIVNTSTSELRIRCLTDYNFIICAQGSPYNSATFDRSSDQFFNDILSRKIKPQQFFDWLISFSKENS